MLHKIAKNGLALPQFSNCCLKFQARLTSLDMPSMDDSQTGGSFLRFAFINMLLDIVYRSKDPRVILDGLRVVCQDPDLNENSDQIKVIKAIQPHSTVKYKVSIKYIHEII